MYYHLTSMWIRTTTFPFSIKVIYLEGGRTTIILLRLIYHQPMYQTILSHIYITNAILDIRNLPCFITSNFFKVFGTSWNYGKHPPPMAIQLHHQCLLGIQSI